MTSIVKNLFSNFNDLTKPKSVTDNVTDYKAGVNSYNKQSPALIQGTKFKKYQGKIANNLEKKIKKSHLVEGFEGLKDLDLNKNGLTEQTNNVLNRNDYTSQQQTITNLKNDYEATLTEYKTLMDKINGNVTNYIDRVNPNNPYLNKTVRFNNGSICYVTNQGVVKGYGDGETFAATAGNNGCPAQSPLVNIDLDFSKYYAVGSVIPTTPPLVTGTPMVKGQSCGNEGSNVFVDSLINNATPTYEGCYGDNTTNPLMTFIGGAPPLPTNLKNGNFEQPQIANNSYKYLGWNNTFIPGWNFNCVIVNNSNAWGYPMPYPHGNQCASIQETQQLWTDWINFNAGVTYTLSFTACGRNCCDRSGKANPINIGIDGTTFYTLDPTLSWQEYTTNFTVGTTGGHRISLIGTWGSSDRSTAFQNFSLSSSGSPASGTYTYDKCKEAAINSGYQYFALQDVNPSTSQGFCAVSNSEPTATSLGVGMVSSGQQPLWASNTTGDNAGSVAVLNGDGTLVVNNSAESVVFTTPVPDVAKADPNPYIGCYSYHHMKNMKPQIGKNYQYTADECMDLVTDNGAMYVGYGGGARGDKIKRCLTFSDLASTKMKGVSKNCKTPNGGNFSADVYATVNADVTGYCFLILQDDGNMCIYKGTGPSDNQGVIWCSETAGKQISANPNFAAEKGKYGKNWIPSGSTLAPGDFVGSTSGNIALIMQSDGNLVLYTYTMTENCQKMADGNTGGGTGANALYNIGKVSVPGNMGHLAYIDQNSQRHVYPNNNAVYSNSYATPIYGIDTPGNDIPGAAFGGATVESCQNACDSNQDCAGFVTNKDGTFCWPKTNGMYPFGGPTSQNSDRNIYVRSKTPKTPPMGVSQNVNNIDTITFGNYVDGGDIGKAYGIANATSTQKQQLEQLQSKLNLLTSQINGYTNKFSSGNDSLNNQSSKNIEGLGDYLKDFEKTYNNIKNFNSTNIENILNDSDITVLQKNYDYLFWSILAAGTVLVTMNIAKKQ